VGCFSAFVNSFSPLRGGKKGKKETRGASSYGMKFLLKKEKKGSSS